MLKNKIKLMELIMSNNLTLSRLSDMSNLSLSYTSELISQLKEEGFVAAEKNTFKIADNVKMHFLIELKAMFSLQKLLGGKNDEILIALLSGSQTISELNKNTGLSIPLIYTSLRVLKEIGVVDKLEKKYHLYENNTLKQYLIILQKEKIRKILKEDYSVEMFISKDLLLKRVPKGKEASGKKTAFSVFPEFGINIQSPFDFYVIPAHHLTLEDVLVHALKVAGTTTEKSLCAIFYLKGKNLDTDKLKKIAHDFEVLPLLEKMIKYIYTHEAGEDFITWDEFKELMVLYNIKEPIMYDKTTTEYIFNTLASLIKEPTKIYIIGGENMIKRNLKTATKDIDMIVDTERELDAIITSFKKMGFKEINTLNMPYKNMRARSIMEKEGMPRIDIFLNIVCNKMRLTESMKSDSEPVQYGELVVCLVSIEDIIIFKSITDRIRDVDDVQIIIKNKDINWSKLILKMKEQESQSDYRFCIDLLQTFEELVKRGQTVPILRNLSIHCLDHSIIEFTKTPISKNDIRTLFKNDFPDYTINNAINRLIKHGRIKKIGKNYLSTSH